MTHTTTVALATQEVLERAKRFFAERIPHAAAFVEREGPGFLVLRGQGGEEVVFSVRADGGPRGAGGGGGGGGGGLTQVRASTLFFDQAVDRFFSTLPLASGVVVA